MLNKRILRVILNDKVSSYGHLLQQIGDCSLNNKRIQNMLIIIFKCLHLDSIRSISNCFVQDLLITR